MNDFDFNDILNLNNMYGGYDNEGELNNNIFSVIAGIMPREPFNLSHSLSLSEEQNTEFIKNETFATTRIQNRIINALDENPVIKMVCPYIGRKRIRKVIKFRKKRKRALKAKNNNDNIIKINFIDSYNSINSN